MMTGSGVRAEVLVLAGVLAVPGMGSGQTAESGAGPIVSMAWLRAQLDSAGTEPLAVIAVDRDGEAFAREHIPGARFLTHQATLDHHSHRLLPPAELATVLARAGAHDAARIVLYGDDPMSLGWLYMALASLGHGDHTFVLDGNARAWRAAGHPVSSTPGGAGTGRLTVRTAPDFVVDAAWVRGHLEDAGTRLLDVRSPREWSNGTIPGGVPILWQDFFADLQLGRFKSPQALRAVFERAGVRSSQTAVTYCAVGMRASLALLAARAAGVPAKVYVGSWADWTATPANPRH
ncbi:MAG TPA: rhodanese-like domain-containing protein [Vicinamibacterales bacterium]|nr:rhodanese-like domain-containing protein [Vicinamibacterales bacterium]